MKVREKKKTKAKKLITLDEADAETVRWLINALSWIPNQQRTAIERLGKRVGV